MRRLVLSITCLVVSFIPLQSQAGPNGVTKAPVEAVKWFHLGVCYYFGEGVKQDSVEAVKWFRKAADRGHADAQKMLEKMERQGTTYTPVVTPPSGTPLPPPARVTVEPVPKSKFGRRSGRGEMGLDAQELRAVANFLRMQAGLNGIKKEPELRVLPLNHPEMRVREKRIREIQESRKKRQERDKRVRIISCIFIFFCILLDYIRRNSEEKEERIYCWIAMFILLVAFVSWNVLVYRTTYTELTSFLED